MPLHVPTFFVLLSFVTPIFYFAMTHSHDYFHALPPATALQNGAFVLREAVGRGGTSFTYRALDVRLGREVAIKEWFPHGSSRDGLNVRASEIEYSMRAAFVEEARALARFDHPNIVRVFAVLEENAAAYIVEEFLDGHTLQHILDASGAFEIDDALQIVAPLCEAVETLHSAGLVHGDIKPANVMQSQNRIVLLDFGLTATLPQSEYATTLLAPQRGVGTSGYAPIEQYSKSGALSPASDVYALAATLWQLLTNELPPDAPGRASGFTLPDLRAIVPQLPENLMRAIEHGLAMNANARPQSVCAWRDELFSSKPTSMSLSPATSSTRSVDFAPDTSQTDRAPDTSRLTPSHTAYSSQFDAPPSSIWSLVLLSCSLFALMVLLLLMG